MAIQNFPSKVRTVQKNRVLLIDSNPLTRIGIRSLVEAMPGDFQMEALECFKEGLERAFSLMPHYLLFDAQYYSQETETQILNLESSFPFLKCILMGNDMSPCMASDRSQNMRRGYVYKKDLPRELEHCMDALHAGETYFSKSFERVIHSYKKATQLFVEKYPGLKELSVREKEVIQQLLKKKSSQEIADSLYTSVRTISNHRYRIRKKLGLTRGEDLLPFLIESAHYFKCLLGTNE